MPVGVGRERSLGRRGPETSWFADFDVRDATPGGARPVDVLGDGRTRLSSRTRRDAGRVLAEPTRQSIGLDHRLDSTTDQAIGTIQTAG